MDRFRPLSRIPHSTYDRRWYSAALKQIADARWKNERLTVISGPAGSGKTTLCRQIADRTGTRTLVVLLADPRSDANGFLRALACEVGVLSKTTSADAPIDTAALRQAIAELFASFATLGADCLVIVDDAHRLEPEARTAVDHLIASWRGRSSLQFVLVGQFDDAIQAPAPLPPPRVARVVRPPRPVPAAADPYATEIAPLAPPAAATAAAVPVAAPVAEVSEPEVPVERRPWFTRRRGVSIAATAAMLAGASVWYGAMLRPRALPTVNPASPNAATSRARAAEAALMAIVGEIDGSDDSAEPSAGSTGATVPKRPGWTDEVVRRAAELAKQPDLPKLIALRSAVAGLRTQSPEEGREVESLLRKVDESLAEARKRQLAIDHRLLTSAGGPRD